MSRARAVFFALLAFGLLLHTYTHAVMAESFYAGFWLWSISPYLLTAVLSLHILSPLAAACALVLPVAADIATYYGVFIAPTSSTAAVGLVATPLWNLLVLLPLGAFIGWYWNRRQKRT